MTIEQRVENLERQMRLLQNATIQAAKNAQPQTEKIDDTANKVTEITPWTASKTAYIGDSECTFLDCPAGNLTVYFNGNYEVVRDGARITVYFDELEEVIEITISII